MRQYLLDLSLEEMSIDLLLQGDFKGREKGIKETPFSIAKKKKPALVSSHLQEFLFPFSALVLS